MKYPVFIYHELVVRLSEIEPLVGNYVNSNFEPGYCMITTSNGSFKVNTDLLEKQYRNPKLITVAEIQQLLMDFDWNGKQLAVG